MNVIEVKGNEMGNKNKQFALELQTLCVCMFQTRKGGKDVEESGAA